MANSDIGRCKCPFCSGDAALRETSKGRAYIVCEGCAVQSFARGPVSDRIMRGMKNASGGNGVGSGGAAVPAVVGGSVVGGGEIHTNAGKAGAGKVGKHKVSDGGGAGAGAERSEKPAAAVPQAEKPAKAPAATVRTHTADGQTVAQEITPPTPEEKTIFDVLGGMFK